MYFFFRFHKKCSTKNHTKARKELYTLEDRGIVLVSVIMSCEGGDMSVYVVVARNIHHGLM